MLLVLFAALLHASWNAVVKCSPDKFLDIVLVTSGAAALSALALPFLASPRPSGCGYVAASVVIHVAYFLLTGASYRSGDMSHAYPLMRGAAPLLVALASGPLIGERLLPGEWGGISLICGGILGLLLMDNRDSTLSAPATRFALLNAVVIACYTLVDGTGVRLSGHPVAYTMWMFLLTAPAILLWPVLRRRSDVIRHLRGRWHFGLVGGACTLGAYILVLWAMTRAPVAMVAALRETAIVFGLAISALVLKARLGWSRPVAAGIILAGVVTTKLAQGDDIVGGGNDAAAFTRKAVEHGTGFCRSDGSSARQIRGVARAASLPWHKAYPDVSRDGCLSIFRRRTIGRLPRRDREDIL